MWSYRKRYGRYRKRYGTLRRRRSNFGRRGAYRRSTRFSRKSLARRGKNFQRRSRSSYKRSGGRDSIRGRISTFLKQVRYRIRGRKGRRPSRRFARNVAISARPEFVHQVIFKEFNSWTVDGCQWMQFSVGEIVDLNPLFAKAYAADTNVSGQGGRTASNFGQTGTDYTDMLIRLYMINQVQNIDIVNFSNSNADLTFYYLTPKRDGGYIALQPRSPIDCIAYNEQGDLGSYANSATNPSFQAPSGVAEIEYDDWRYTPLMNPHIRACFNVRKGKQCRVAPGSTVKATISNGDYEFAGIFNSINSSVVPTQYDRYKTKYLLVKAIGQTGAGLAGTPPVIQNVVKTPGSLGVLRKITSSYSFSNETRKRFEYNSGPTPAVTTTDFINEQTQAIQTYDRIS